MITPYTQLAKIVGANYIMYEWLSALLKFLYENWNLIKKLSLIGLKVRIKHGKFFNECSSSSSSSWSAIA